MAIGCMLMGSGDKQTIIIILSNGLLINAL